MYKRIAVPIDLSRAEELEKAIRTAVLLAGATGAELHLISVTGLAPGEVAHDPVEFEEKLREFAGAMAREHGAAFATHVITSNDPSPELDQRLDAWCHEHDVDLIVVASHVPGLREYLFSSNAGWLASHSDLSVFVVR